MRLPVLQHTLGKLVASSGVGLHGGLPVRMTLKPAPVDHGIVFVRTDVKGHDNRVAATAASVVRTVLHTEIANAAGVMVSTIEHLMAALCALNVDNAVVEIDGPELPIMDGSSEPFVALIERAGVREQGAPRRYLEMVERVEVVDGDKSALLEPAAAFHVDFEIEFASRAIGRQRVALDVDAASFKRELARARTFGFAHEIEHLRTLGLARGGSLDNAVLVDGDRVVNPEGLRFADEFARHKALDAVGDLYVLGAPVIGRFAAVRAGHAINNLLVRAVAARPQSFREGTFAPAFAQAV